MLLTLTLMLLFTTRCVCTSNYLYANTDGWQDSNLMLHGTTRPGNASVCILAHDEDPAGPSVYRAPSLYILPSVCV